MEYPKQVLQEELDRVDNELVELEGQISEKDEQALKLRDRWKELQNKARELEAYLSLPMRPKIARIAAKR